MMTWLWSQLMPVSALLAIILICRPFVLRWFGPRCQYSLWLVVPALLLLSVVPELIALRGDDAAGTTPYILTVMGSLEQASETIQQVGDHTIVWVVWLAGVAILLLKFLQQFSDMQQRLSGAAQLPWRGLLLRVSEQCTGPLLTGWLRPIVVVPADFQQRFSVEQQQFIIEHELTHWQRGDLQSNLLAWGIVTLFWFNPLCWLAYHAYRQDQELACDALVLQGTTPQQKAAYSYALLNSTQQPSDGWRVLTTHYGDKHMIKQRIKQLQRQQGFSKVGRLFALIAGVTAVLMLQNPAIAAAKVAVSPEYRVEPKYPLQAATDRVEGYVVAEFDVLPDGSVSNIKIVKSVPTAIFDKVSTKALSQWRYKTSAAGQKQVLVQLDFMMDSVPQDIERVKVIPQSHSR